VTLKGLYLTLMIGPMVPVPVPPPVLDALVSAQVTTSATDRSGFQLQFHFSKASLISTVLIPAGFFDPGIRVILMATVNGIPNVLMDGMITRQDVAPSNTPGSSTLTLTGEDIAVFMSLVDLTGIMQYPALRPSDRVYTILGRYAMFGIIPLVIPSPLEEPALPTERVFAQEGTDYDYVKKLATDTGYTFYIDPGPVPGTNVAYWGPEIRIGIPQPALNINMDAETNIDSLSFSYNGLQGTNEIALIQQQQTRVPIPIPVPDLSLLSPPLAIRSATKLKTKFLGETANLTPIQALARALGSQRESSDAIGGTGTLDVLRYGRVLKARGLVGVRGAGLAYDGLYYVKSVTHNIKPGEYKQQFTLSRNGLVSITPVVPT
jgi:hypothetical protein